MPALSLTLRPITAADRKRVSCNLEGYWGIFEGDRVAAVDRDRARLEQILADVHGLTAEQIERIAA